MTEAEAIRVVASRLDEMLPADAPGDANGAAARVAVVTLVNRLWCWKGSGGRELAWTLPVLASDGTTPRASVRRLMVPPVLVWPEAAQPFGAAFPPNRVLANDYVSGDDGGMVLDALADWGIMHRTLLMTFSRGELRDRALRAVARDPDAVGDGVVRDTEMSQIALLEPEVINHVKHERDFAKALLGLLIAYVANSDASWRTTVNVALRHDGEDTPLAVTPSLWLADLKSKPWIPIVADDAVTHHLPNPSLLRDLMDSYWLEGNSAGADLLVQHFGMDALDVRLLAATSDEETRQRLRVGLARIVDVAGPDPAVLEEFASKAEQRQADVNRMRRLGLAVQTAVGAALERLGLDVVLVDKGFDFLVGQVEVSDDAEADLSVSFEVGNYKVEVKASTTKEARLTPLQARTALQDAKSFVLCVVDLQGLAEHVHDVEWTADNVEPLCSMLSADAIPISETLLLVDDAESVDVPIRNATALRYAVREELWSRGDTLEGWVRRAFGD